MTAKLVLLFLFFTIVIFVNSNECDSRCDCDQVAQGCPGPRFCMKPDPDCCANFIQCNDAGLVYVLTCQDGLYYSDITLQYLNNILLRRFYNINIIGTCITNQSKLCSNSLRLTTTSSSSSVRTYYTLCIDSCAKKGGGGGGKNDKKEKDVAYDSVKDADLNTMKSSCDATVDFLRRGFGNIRCGRTGPELLDLITVETPNGPMSTA
ncbi:hypothetical protein PPL_11843 [Heterostelium album PN500]|uniref:Uncharacterized protein n=1 Tax=Heterostelium pallidum (strain ATCC 26659 / Pp 5 / PN500) TaxID=670386 RepID=D3BUM2_HETP5|nr:hypothetical protein PPL_11843 [Heterostelium album PN500]EFA74810.1 hypothetical protein PPL_11843 [Heterostelium album PN500]|eukprot:XP_020426944.1 hypothetical protein PPL_11843 [Heterostelium album PN500]